MFDQISELKFENFTKNVWKIYSPCILDITELIIDTDVGGIISEQFTDSKYTFFIISRNSNGDKLLQNRKIIVLNSNNYDNVWSKY